MDILRYDRQIINIGVEGQRKINSARLVIVGLGGLGSNVAMQMAAAGIGFLRLIDPDKVDVSNINRQPLYNESDVGKLKVDAASQNLKKINSKLELETFPMKLDENNAESLIRGVDLILDGLDGLHERLILNKYAVKLNIPYIFASVQDAFGSVTTIIPHRTACLSCFMKDSDPMPPCAIGVYPPAVFAISSIVASEALAMIIQRKPALAGRLLVFDLETMSFDSVSLRKNPTCKVCGV
ncbi:MAG: HesA/MoeB/ThiF family protein [Thermoprotei archaeon]